MALTVSKVPRVGSVDQGQIVQMTATFRTPDGALYSPDAVTFTIRRESLDLPDESSDSSEPGDGEDRYTFNADDSSSEDGGIDHPSTGVFTLNVDTSYSGGNYLWRITSSDAAEPAEAKSGTFYVKPWQNLA